VTPSSPAIKVYNDVHPDTGTHFYIAMPNPSNATTDDAFTFPISTADGTYTPPQSGTLRINGQDSRSCSLTTRSAVSTSCTRPRS
jgi:hypothetical protein